MATIASATNQLRHVRKTIALNGGANNGQAASEVTIFTPTGQVVYDTIMARCTVDLVSGGAAVLSLGFAGATDFFIYQLAYSSITAGKYLEGTGPSAGIAGPNIAGHGYGSGAALVFYPETANITAGTLIVDAWYRPITDDGALAGDDIDAGYMPADVKAWLGTAAATPTVGGVPEVDLTHVAGSTTSVSALATGMATLLADWINGGRLDLILDIIAADTTTDIPATLATIAGYLDTEIAAVLADTNELQTDWANGGRLDLLIDAIKAVTDLLTAAHSEPTGVPAADETPLDKLAYLFMALRNKVTVTATKKQFFDDGGAAEWEKDLSDDGTTYTETEANAP